MNLVYNELSNSDLAQNSYTARKRISELILQCGLLFDQGFKRLSVSERFFECLISENYTLNDWLADPEVATNEKKLLPGIIQYPYINDSDDEALASYIENNILLDESDHPMHGIHGQGLATSWIKNELSISLNSHLVWQKLFIGLDVKPDSGTMIKVRVPNIHSYAQFGLFEIQSWYNSSIHIKIKDSSDILKKYPNSTYDLSEQAIEDILYWINENRPDYVEKIEAYLKDIKISPFRGKGKPEPLKGNLAGWWSRRITDEDRFIYRIEHGIIHLRSAKGHYKD